MIKDHSKIAAADVILVSDGKLIERSQVMSKIREGGTLIVCSRQQQKLQLTADTSKALKQKKVKLLRFDEYGFRKENKVPDSMKSNMFYA